MFNHVQRVAHRGGAALAPENTLAAFRNALEFPIDAIEFDVHMSRDGHAIILHDYTVDRLTNGSGNILDLDFAYLRSLNAAAHFPGGWPEPQQIPTLREVLDLARGRVQVQIQIKPSKRESVYDCYPNIVETVLAEVRAADMLGHALIISSNWRVLRLLKSLEPHVQTGVIIFDDTWVPCSDDAPAKVIGRIGAAGLECSWVLMKHVFFTDTAPAVAHQHGLKLGVWTVNGEDEMRRFAAAGVDAITSDRPDLLAML